MQTPRDLGTFDAIVAAEWTMMLQTSRASSFETSAGSLKKEHY
jgi:hypothetical protein